MTLAVIGRRAYRVGTEAAPHGVAHLRALGFTVFPCDPNKRPKVRWQAQPPSKGWTFGPHDLIGVVMPLGTVAVDVDDPVLFEASGLDLPSTFTQRTRRSGGTHAFYRTTQPVGQTQATGKGYDTRVGGKGYVVAWEPESWFAVEDWTLAPEWLYGRSEPPREPSSGTIQSIPRGERHDYYLRFAGRLKNAGLHDPNTMFAALCAENARISPDHDTADLRGIADSIAAWEGGEDEFESEHEVVRDAAAEWPEPPMEAAYHGVLGAIVRAISPHTEADPIGLLGSGLAIFGALAGGNSVFHQSGQHKANIFVCLVGETALGRKGTAFSVMNAVFRAIQPDWTQKLITGLGSGEGLLTYLKDNPDPRGLVYEGEFASLLTAMTREGSTLSPTIRNAWDGIPLGRYVVSKQGSGTIANHHIGILTNITDIDLSQKLTTEDAANGFANRFLWLAVRRQKLVPITSPHAEFAEPFLAQLREALAFAERDNLMRFSPEARAYWTALYYARSSVLRAGMHAAVTNRGDSYIARLAMLYAMLDATPIIRIEHLQAAEAVWDYAERSALHIFGDSTGNKRADALLRELQLDSPIGVWEAQRACGIPRADDMNQAIALLVRMGRVEEFTLTPTATSRRKGGRRKRMLRLRANVTNAQVSSGRESEI